MAEVLKEICTILFDDLSKNHFDVVAADKSIQSCLDRIKKSQGLDPTFNLAHKRDGHCRFFPLKKCQQVHCFECLAKDLVDGKNQCEHNVELTRAEKVEILVLSQRFNK
jgi:hypothetical protein